MNHGPQGTFRTDCLRAGWELDNGRKSILTQEKPLSESGNENKTRSQSIRFLIVRRNENAGIHCPCLFHRELQRNQMRVAGKPASSQMCCRQKLRRLPELCRLLKRVRQLDQCRLTPGAPEEGNAHREAEEISGWNRDARVTRHGSRR
jgi:hypothetical protein